MKNRILIKLVVPSLDLSYEVFIPYSKKIGSIIPLLVNGISNLGNDIKCDKSMAIYNKLTGERYDSNVFVSQTDIVEGTELILI